MDVWDFSGGSVVQLHRRATDHLSVDDNFNLKSPNLHLHLFSLPVFDFLWAQTVYVQ